MENYQRKSSRIARRAVYQGVRPTSIDQCGIEKSATGSKSSQVIVDTPLLEETTSHRGGASKSRLDNTESKRCKWSEDDYITVIRAYYEAKHHPKRNSCATIRIFKDIFVIEFYDNPSMLIDIGNFFYVRHDIFYSFGLSLHFPLKLMSNHD